MCLANSLEPEERAVVQLHLAELARRHLHLGYWFEVWDVVNCVQLFIVRLYIAVGL